MTLVDHSQGEHSRICEAVFDTVDSLFMPDGGEVHICQLFRWLFRKSRVLVTRYA